MSISLRFLLRERQVLIFFSLLLLLVDIHAGIHSADLGYGVLILSLSSITIRRFVPTMLFRMPAEPERFQAFLVWFGVAGDPHETAYDFDLYAVQLQELGDQPLKFLRRFVFRIENFHFFIAAANVRMQFQAKSVISFLQFFQCFNIFIEISRINYSFE